MKYCQVLSKQTFHLTPCEEECVDMIGPWKVSITSEVISVKNATSKLVTRVFEDNYSADTQHHSDIYMIIQFNVIVEKMHLSISTMISISFSENLPNKYFIAYAWEAYIWKRHDISFLQQIKLATIKTTKIKQSKFNQ